MKEYILLLPIIFIFHDMEEIVGFGHFLEKNPDIFKKFPRVMETYKSFSTEGFAMAVYEEFIPFFGIGLLAYYFPSKILYTLWFALMLALTVHFVIHILQSIILWKYIPSLITSIICLPVSILILNKCIEFISFGLIELFLILLAMLVMIVNLKFAHKLMHLFAQK
jgi:hypothetical protein